MARVRWTFEAIGTQWEIDVEAGEEIAPRAYEAVRARIEQFDKDYSRFRNDSLVSAIAKNAGRYAMPEDWPPLWELYRKLHNATDGAVNILVGGLLEDVGYDAAYSFTERPLRKIPESTALSFDGLHLSVSEPVVIDIGAAGKGYCIDIVATILEENDISSYTIDAGGDIAHAGAPLRVALEDPQDASLAVGVIEIENESICASAWNRRQWGARHHIIDPRTGESPKDILATWVIAKRALEADGLATALFFTEPKNLSEFSFEWAVMRADRSVRFSPRFERTFSD